MSRVATHQHICTSCGAIIICYRDCDGEAHIGCAEKLPDNKMAVGRLKLQKVYTIEEAKKLDIKAKFV
jgi:hypothetical protein